MSSSSTARKRWCRSACAGRRAPAATRRSDMSGRVARALLALGLAGVCGSASGAAMDPVNPTCPSQLNWSTYPRMKFTLATSNGQRVLQAEGVLDEDVPLRLQEALQSNGNIDEIWLR